MNKADQYPKSLSRREFVAATAAGLMTAGTLGVAEGDENEQVAKPFRISIAPWSLMRTIAGRPDHEGVALWDYPKVVAEMGFEAIEHDNLHFAGELPDSKVITRMRKTCDDVGIESSLILCGALGDIADEDAAMRAAAVDKYRKWADAAKTLGCHSIRVVCADRKTNLSFDEKRKRAVDGIRSLAEHNAKLSIDLLIENHGGYSSDPRWLTQVIKDVALPNCGILADFTHWSVQRNPEVNVVDPYEGMKLLAPHTRSVSAHAYDFDANGDETKWDYARMMKILVNAGFHGDVAVEYFGKKLSRIEGSTKARKLLERVREKLS